jgi:16S rRNA C1402 (ribose-2'-O) methylase RsmI
VIPPSAICVQVGASYFPVAAIPGSGSAITWAVVISGMPTIERVMFSVDYPYESTKESVQFIETAPI